MMDCRFIALPALLLASASMAVVAAPTSSMQVPAPAAAGGVPIPRQVVPPPGASSAAALPAAGEQRAATGCLGGEGYLTARIRGALVRDLDWRARLACDGEARPDGSGVRLSFVAPPGRGKRLRLVFGVRGVQEGVAGKELPTNLTVMEEGGRLFSTRGDDRCTVDELRQQPVQPGAATRTGAGVRTWRITARGFCTDPAVALAGAGRIVVTRFDFMGVVSFHGAPPRR